MASFEIQAFTNRGDVQEDAIDRISIQSAGRRVEIPADEDNPDVWPRRATYKCNLLNGRGRGARAEVTFEWPLNGDALNPQPDPDEGRCVESVSAQTEERGRWLQGGRHLDDCKDTDGLVVEQRWPRCPPSGWIALKALIQLPRRWSL